MSNYWLGPLAKFCAVWFGVVLLRSDTSRKSLSELLSKIRPVNISVPLKRLGPEGDGGYVVPDDFEGCDGLISPGVGDISDFEFALAEKGLNILLLDGSVEGPSRSHQNFVFWKKFLASSQSVTTVTLKNALGEFPVTRDLCLQMDIEGGEWEVLATVDSESLKRFRMIIVEVHGFAQRVLSKTGFLLAHVIFEKLLQDFVVAHVHVNNATRSYVLPANQGQPRAVLPNTFELTLIRKDRVRIRGGTPKLPSDLDSRNVSWKPDSELPNEWTQLSL